MSHALRGRTRYPGLIDTNVSGFTPLSVTSLRWWLRGESLDGQLTGTPVTDWLDESGYGNHTTQAVEENIPSLDKAALNGHSGVVFVNDLLSTSGSMDLGQAITMFIVFNNTNTNFEGLWDTAPLSGNVFRNIIEAGTGIIDWWNLEPSVALNCSPGNHIVNIELYTDTGIRNIDYWRDGSFVSNTTFSNNDGLTWTDFPGIGAYNVNGGYFVGTVYETLWFNEVLSSPNRTLIENYLLSKYAL